VPKFGELPHATASNETLVTQRKKIPSPPLARPDLRAPPEGKSRRSPSRLPRSTASPPNSTLAVARRSSLSAPIYDVHPLPCRGHLLLCCWILLPTCCIQVPRSPDCRPYSLYLGSSLSTLSTMQVIGWILAQI
jgi:hypothetical protein